MKNRSAAAPMLARDADHASSSGLEETYSHMQMQTHADAVNAYLTRAPRGMFFGSDIHQCIIAISSLCQTLSVSRTTLKLAIFEFINIYSCVLSMQGMYGKIVASAVTLVGRQNYFW